MSLSRFFFRPLFVFVVPKLTHIQTICGPNLKTLSYGGKTLKAIFLFLLSLSLSLSFGQVESQPKCVIISGQQVVAKLRFVVIVGTIA
ncbi:hypothetical protein M5D96_010154 [Drosophila gunungcola]|uniref:Uncharacterized protein n=1 Tax=Drosophila gunungcola TaxID=103775 RepID=A0A9Q0BMG0_9MUSC|nr:hypothetical protein M5D96_010154 [Drosophila gunungcola]